MLHLTQWRFGEISSHDEPPKILQLMLSSYFKQELQQSLLYYKIVMYILQYYTKQCCTIILENSHYTKKLSNLYYKNHHCSTTQQSLLYLYLICFGFHVYQLLDHWNGYSTSFNLCESNAKLRKVRICKLNKPRSDQGLKCLQTDHL